MPPTDISPISFFLNIANNYTHPIVYNNYINQLTFENIVGKYMSTYLSNPSGDTLQNVLKKELKLLMQITKRPSQLTTRS